MIDETKCTSMEQHKKHLPIVNEEDRVIFFDTDLATTIIYNNVEYSETPNLDLFEAEFENIDYDYLANEDYYRGLNMTAVIKRKSDGRLFGYSYWKLIGKYEDGDDVEGNGHDILGEPDWEWWDNYDYNRPYVFLPVEEITITGYRVMEDAAMWSNSHTTGDVDEQSQTKIDEQLKEDLPRSPYREEIISKVGYSWYELPNRIAGETDTVYYTARTYAQKQFVDELTAFEGLFGSRYTLYSLQYFWRPRGCLHREAQRHRAYVHSRLHKPRLKGFEWRSELPKGVLSIPRTADVWDKLCCYNGSLEFLFILAFAAPPLKSTRKRRR